MNITVIALVALDCVQTLIAVSYGATEMNPACGAMGFKLFMVIKILLLIIYITYVQRFRSYWQCDLFLVAVYGAVTVSNLIQIIRAC